MTTFEIRLLGGMTIVRDGTIVQPFQTRKSAGLCAYLALQSRRPHGRAALAAMFWPDSSPRRAAHNLRQALTFLRQALLVEDAVSPLLINRREVRFTPNPSYVVDVNAFQAVAGSVDMTKLARAAALYRGPLLAGFDLPGAPAFDTFVTTMRERLQVQALDTLDRLADRYLTRGDYGAAKETLLQALKLDAWHEQAHRGLMRVLALSGDPGGALAQYERCRVALQEGLGVEPLPSTIDLYERIKTGTLVPPEIETRPLRAIFVGRGTEHAALADLLSAADKPRILMIEGESGVGKSRLLGEFSRYAAAHGAVTLTGHAYEFRAPLPYAPLAAALRQGVSRGPHPLSEPWRSELARLLPEVGSIVPSPSARGDRAARQRLFMSIDRFLATVGGKAQRVLLLLDDLQWVDGATLDVVHYLVHEGTGSLRIVGTYRPEDTPGSHPLTRLRRSLQRDGLARVIPLAPLSAEDTDAIAAAMMLPPESSGQERVRRTFADFLYRESEGNGYVMQELLADLADRGILQPVDGVHWALPETWSPPRAHLTDDLREVVLNRISRLAPESQRALELAATIGRTFSLDLLAAVSETAADALAPLLQSWVERRLVEPIEDRYDFAHDKTRATLYFRSDPKARRQRHQRIARAMEKVAAETAPAEIAHHFLHGNTPERALPFLTAAVARAETALAFAEAARLCTAALALLEDDLEQRFRWLARRQRAYQFLGQPEREGADAVALLETARAIGSDRYLADAAQRLGRFHYLRGDLAGARQALSGIVGDARRTGQTETVLRLLDMVAMLFRDSEPGRREALRLQDEAVELAREAGNARGEALLLCDQALVLCEDGRLGDGHHQVYQGLEQLRARGDRAYLPHAMYIAAAIERFVGRLDRAAGLLNEADALCRSENLATYRAQILLGKIDLALEKRDLAGALRRGQNLLDLAEERRRRLLQGRAHARMGLASYLTHDFVGAFDHCTRAIGLDGSSEGWLVVRARATRALALLGMEDTESAMRDCELVLTVLDDNIGRQTELPYLLWQVHLVLRECGRRKAAARRLAAARQLLQSHKESLPQSLRACFADTVVAEMIGVTSNE